MKGHSALGAGNAYAEILALTETKIQFKVKSIIFLKIRVINSILCVSSGKDFPTLTCGEPSTRPGGLLFYRVCFS